MLRNDGSSTREHVYDQMEDFNHDEFVCQNTSALVIGTMQT